MLVYCPLRDKTSLQTDISTDLYSLWEIFKRSKTTNNDTTLKQINGSPDKDRGTVYLKERLTGKASLKF